MSRSQPSRRNGRFQGLFAGRRTKTFARGAARRAKRRPMKIESLEQRLVLAGDIAGVVFHDFNGDGTQDAGDVGIGGATVFLDTNRDGAWDETLEASRRTDVNGNYAFTGLTPGPYTVAQVLPDGWLQTAAGSPGVGRLGEVTDSVAAAGEGTIGGTVWLNGMIYQVEAVPGDNKVWKIDPQTGDVELAFTGPSELLWLAHDGDNFWGTDLTNDKIYHFSAPAVAGQPATLIDTFSSPASSPTGIAWDDGNLWVADNIADLVYKMKLQVDEFGEPQLVIEDTITSPAGSNFVGLTVDGQHLWVSDSATASIYQIDRADGQIVQSFATTLASGGYSRGMAFDGQHLWSSDSVSRKLLQVDPGGDHRNVTVGINPATANFGNVPLATISGMVFYDGVVTNGERDPGEIGLEGRKVFLDHDQDGLIDSGEAVVLTDADGNYQLSVRIGRDYTVAQILPPVNWRQVSPTDPAHTVTIDSSGRVITGVDFADILDRFDPLKTDWVPADGGMKNLYTGLAWAEGVPLSSTNWSGAQIYAENATVGGFDDWRTPSKDEAQQAAINGAGQQGFLRGVSFGRWWTSTTASGNKAWTVEMNNPVGLAETTSKESITYYFTVRDTATTIDDGSSGYTNTSGWTNKSSAAAHAGDYRQTGAGNGSKTATWTFTGLEVGASYKIASSWFAASANASNSPFTIRDGGVSEGTVLINQRLAANDFKVGNTWWEGLGTFTADSTTFTVTLSNQANGTVVADAIRLFKVYDSYLGSSESLTSSSTSDDGGLAALSFGVEATGDDVTKSDGGAGGQRSSGTGGRQAAPSAGGAEVNRAATSRQANSGGGLGGNLAGNLGGSNFAARDTVFSLSNDFLLDSLLTNLAAL